MQPQWKKQEKALEREGLRRVPGSGSGYRKGDARGVDFLVQCKATSKRKLIITQDDVFKARVDAHKEERIPVIQYELSDPAYRYAVLLEPDLHAIAWDAAYEIEDWKMKDPQRWPLLEPRCVRFDLVWYVKLEERKKRYSLTLDLIENRVQTARTDRHHIGCVFAFSDVIVALLRWAAFCEIVEEAELQL